MNTASSLQNRIDTQGLLDRVFPLPTDSPGSSVAASSQSSPQPQSYSFRTLLKESSRHSLRVLRVRFHSTLSATISVSFSSFSLRSSHCSPSLLTPVPGRLRQQRNSSNSVISPFLSSTNHLFASQTPFLTSNLSYLPSPK
jgi:hypothetical protein